MSYASGMALGLTIGQQLLKYFAQGQNKNNGFNFEQLGQDLNSFNETIQEQTVRLAHAIKGRRRYYIDALKKNEKLAKLISVKLSEMPFIKEVSTNINTGSLLILYSCAENIIDDIFTQLKERVFNISNKIVEYSNKKTTVAGNAILNFVKQLNKYIKQKTNNLIDLRILLSGLLIIRGGRKVLTLKQRPNGPQMLWWAFSILRGLGK